ncbi:uncharacterized protein LOC119557644 [Drosophila subpulchrella]|uniref:uncharacterized protein LOC119557644 n=1 Tax=Drosophila subpulchrella TaxID=1486046 RepID=UPI0018A19440|nr:uncharacterized protein LOC119557644 [Drosophila subpulchrella]
MERRRPRKSSRHFLRSKSNPSVGGGGGGGGGGPSSATSRVSSQQPDGNGTPTITSLLGGRLKRVSRITRAPRGMHVTENPDEGGVAVAPIRDSEQSEGSDVNPGVMVAPASASPRGSAVHGPLVGVAFGSNARNSESPRISEEVEEVFRTSSQRSVSVVGTGNLRFDSTPDARDESTMGNINFAPNSYYEENRHSSMESNESNGNRADSTPSLGACSHGWTQQQLQPASGHGGRDTLGFAIHLGTATMGHNRCSLGVNCDEECGYGTGCDAGCSDAHGIDPGSFAVPRPTDPGPTLVMSQGPGGPPVNSALRGAHGPAVGPAGGYPAGGGYKPGPPGQRGSMGSDFGTDQLNFFITFLLEVLGVLVFFAICTITFWITLGYHVVQLLVDLKNADRNVQVAVAIVFGLLLIAFAISQVTNRSGACCHSRDRARSRSKGGGICPFHRSTKTKAKAKPKSCGSRTKSCAYKPKNKKAPNDGGGSRRASTCGAKMDFHSHRKTRYTDCEGRAIFLSSRRYAIPTEMKQPPTIVLWLRDAVAQMMR